MYTKGQVSGVTGLFYEADGDYVKQSIKPDITFLGTFLIWT